MTNANNNNNSQEIYAILAELAQRQLETQAQINRTQQQIERTQQQLENTQDEVRSLANDVTRVLGRSAVLDDVVLELRDNQDVMRDTFNRHLENFNEHQRTTNAALNSLEAINLKLIEIITRDIN